MQFSIRLLSLLTLHQKADIAYAACFLFGQWLFLLRRADLGVRSPMNALKSRRQFFYLNWVTLLYRVVIEFGLFFYPYRHADVNSLLSLEGLQLPSWLHVPQNWIFVIFLGIFSDGLLDWVLGRGKFLGITIPDRLKEDIPQLPEVRAILDTAKAQKASAIQQDANSEDQS